MLNLKMGKTKKSGIMVSHGMVIHSLEECDDCLECLDVQIEYYKAIRKAGGMKKFVKQLKEEITN